MIPWRDGRAGIVGLLILAAVPAMARAFELPSLDSPADIVARHSHDHRRWAAGGTGQQCEDQQIAIGDFINGADGLGAEGRAALDAAAGQVDGQSCAVTATGYASLIGPASANQSISLARAESVLSYLTGLGLDFETATAQGLGGTDQFGPRQADNRRVVVSFTAP